MVEADVLEAARLDGRQRARHAVDERLAADEARFTVSKRLAHEILTAAKADFERDPRNGNGKQGTEIGGRRPGRVDRQLRQQRYEQRRAMGPQFVTLPASEKGPRRNRGCAGLRHGWPS